MTITIILGAGSSQAYLRHRYPLLKDLLSEMLVYADKLTGRGIKQRTYLAYALSNAYGIDAQGFENNRIPEEVIQRKYEDVKRRSINAPIPINEIFNKIEKLSNEHSTTAYWALSYSIGIYMWQMSEENIEKDYLGDRDTAHRELIHLIDKLLLNGCSVNVVDFNYDCVLEFEKGFCGTTLNFNWECGRERKVITDTFDNRTLSELVDANCFMEPLDKGNYKAYAGLIKPHGDYCTFLRGDNGIFHKGGRHSQEVVAIFPEQLTDTSPNDKFLRCSILPPTESRFRHTSTFYDEEIERMIKSLNNSEAVLIIGWSAGGTDDFYKKIFNDALGNSSLARDIDIYIIDKSSEKDAKNLISRIKELFDNRAIIKHKYFCGFNEDAVRNLKSYLM